MAIISMFYGIIISMYYLDNKQHNLPHIHVKYQDEEAVISISDGQILEGSLKINKMKLVQAWIEIHNDELVADWDLAINGEAIFKIDPLNNQKMNPRVINVKPEKNFSLLLTFSNGEVKRFDVNPYLGIGIFKELKDLSIFNSVKPFLGSIQWGNGVDLCPDTLYMESNLV